MSKYALVKVSWVDSSLIEGWAEVDDLPGRPRFIVESAGYLVGNEDDRIFIASSTHEGTAAGITVIPRDAIVTKVPIPEMVEPPDGEDGS